MMTRQSVPTSKKTNLEKRPKDLVLLQLALVLLAEGTLTYERLQREFLLKRRTAERYLADLRAAGLPIEKKQEGRTVAFCLAEGRSKTLSIEAVDVPPAAARSLSLLMVAAALLPANLGVREAVDSTVRAALRLRGLKAAAELRRVEDAVTVLEDNAKDYADSYDHFQLLMDATLGGHLIRLTYESAQKQRRTEICYSATVGLYRGGLYCLAVSKGENGDNPRWLAMERMSQLEVDWKTEPMEMIVRTRALRAASERWGPARPHPVQAPSEKQIITLHFSPQAAPYVLARPWHEKAEVEPWPEEKGGGLRMGIRLAGDTSLFESWVRSWGPEVQVLRPKAMAERIAESFQLAADRHRNAAQNWEKDLIADD
jgi:predicted DNA-binding transcriptional regulator YafY